MAKLKKVNALVECLDQISLYVFYGKFKKEDLHIYVPFNDAFYFYRINLNPSLESECQIMSEQEVFRDLDELHDAAYAKAKKFKEIKYDNAAVLFVNDEADPPIEDTFGFTIEQKRNIAVLLYVLKSQMPEEEDTGE